MKARVARKVVFRDECGYPYRKNTLSKAVRIFDRGMQRGFRWFQRAVLDEHTVNERAAALYHFGYIGKSLEWLLQVPEEFWDRPVKEWRATQ